MNDREKLKRIIEKAALRCLPSSTQPLHINMLTIELLANGVTIQRWIPVTERLPEKQGYYLTVTQNGDINNLPYSLYWREFNAFDGDDNADFAIPVTHWMPLPEPPKEVE